MNPNGSILRDIANSNQSMNNQLKSNYQSTGSTSAAASSNGKNSKKQAVSKTPIFSSQAKFFDSQGNLIVKDDESNFSQINSTAS